MLIKPAGSHALSQPVQQHQRTLTEKESRLLKHIHSRLGTKTAGGRSLTSDYTTLGIFRNIPHIKFCKGGTEQQRNRRLGIFLTTALLCCYKVFLLWEETLVSQVFFSFKSHKCVFYKFKFQTHIHVFLPQIGKYMWKSSTRCCFLQQRQHQLQGRRAGPEEPGFSGPF